MSPVPPLRFTDADVDQAFDAWGCNCGPTALAAVIDKTLDEVRPHLMGFEFKHYVNPTMMLGALRNLGVAFDWSIKRDQELNWPRYGLARIQWHGPWSNPGVPPRVAYRHTHWVGACDLPGNTGIFDVNAMASGGWIRLADWTHTLVPWLLLTCLPKANGSWHITHSIEITR
jgi:hypothetical protein